MTVIPFNEPLSYPYSYCEYSGKELDNLSIVVSAEAERVKSPAGYILSYIEGV